MEGMSWALMHFQNSLDGLSHLWHIIHRLGLNFIWILNKFKCQTCLFPCKMLGDGLWIETEFKFLEAACVEWGTVFCNIGFPRNSWVFTDHGGMTVSYAGPPEGSKGLSLQQWFSALAFTHGDFLQKYAQFFTTFALTVFFQLIFWQSSAVLIHSPSLHGWKV